MKIVLLETAQRRFEEEDVWWRAHRDEKELFAEEFEAVLGDLPSLHAAGQRYRLVRGKLIQRWLMKKTRCHVYYSYDHQGDVLEIHSIWGARRRRGPGLGRTR